MQDCADESGLQFIKFDFVTGGQKIKIDFLVEKTLLAVILCLYNLVNISLISFLFLIFSSYFKIIEKL